MDANDSILMVLGAGLGIAVLTDFTSHRIPNWLTASIVMACLVLHGVYSQWDGVQLAATGLVVGLLCFLPSYLCGAMGAGDVKLMAAIGAALGAWNVLLTALLTIVAGGVIALVYISLRGGVGAMVRRYGCMVMLLVQRQPQYLPPAADEAAAQRFPYALAIACGTALSVWYVTSHRTAMI